MRCPVCGSDIPDGSLACPYCDSELSQTRTKMRPLNRWCPVCGALVSDEMETCPACGSPLNSDDGGRERPREPDPAVDEGLAQDGAEAEGGPDGEGDDVPSVHMDTAIPSPGEGPTSRVASQLSTRTLVLAMVAALAVMGGLVLYIAHPWSPGSNRGDKETIEVDTSTAGSPGELSSISSQDGDAGTPRLGSPGSRTTYEWECDAYAMIQECASLLDENQALLESVGTGETTTGLDAGSDSCSSLSRRLAALEADLGGTAVDEAYSDDVAHLIQLAEWLSAWADALGEGWDGVAASAADDRSQVVDEVLASSGVTDEKALYQQWAATWEPVNRG